MRFEVRSVYDDLGDLVDRVDVVASSEIIEHIYYPQRFLSNINPIIREGGLFDSNYPLSWLYKNLTLSIFNKWDGHHTVDWEGRHVKFFSQKTISSMLEVSGDIVFNNAGRVRWLWKSMVCRAQKNSTNTEDMK